jgi:hypothetical protein
MTAQPVKSVSATKPVIRVAAPALGGIFGALALEALAYAFHPTSDNAMLPVILFVQHLCGAR